jgi:hypothetical protein
LDVRRDDRADVEMPLSCAIRVSIARSPSPLSRRTIARSAALASIVEASTPIRSPLTGPSPAAASSAQARSA